MRSLSRPAAAAQPLRPRPPLAESAAAWWTALASVCVVLLLPLTLVDVPPLLDYPNHLARAYLLAFGPGDPVLSHMAVSHWAIIPNLAIDVLLPAAMRVWAVHDAGRIVLGVIVVLPLLGCAALAGAVFGRRSWWALASGIAAYDQLFLLGFLNFQLSVGLALLFAAAWARWRTSRPGLTALGGVAATALLFACHLMGLLFYLALVAALEWREAIRSGRHLARAAGRVLPLLPVPLILYAVSPLGRQAADTGWWTAEYKLVHIATAFLNYDGGLDGATALLFTGFLTACAATGRLLMPPAAVSLAALGALYLASPFSFKGTSFLDVRFAVMFGFAAFALLQPRLSRRAGAAVGACAGVLFVARMLALCVVWHGHAAELAELRDVIAPVRPGERVLVATVAESDAPDYWRQAHGQSTSDGTRIDLHVGALLTIERHAFWPFLFADPTQQPIRLLPPFRELAEQTRNIPNARQLNGRGLTSADLAAFPIATRWECCYDHVLLLHAGALPGFSTPRLVLERGGAYAALYRVRTDPRTMASAPRPLPE